MTEFIMTISELGCMPAFIGAAVCLAAMTALTGYGIYTLVKEINQ